MIFNNLDGTWGSVPYPVDPNTIAYTGTIPKGYTVMVSMAGGVVEIWDGSNFTFLKETLPKFGSVTIPFPTPLQIQSAKVKAAKAIMDRTNAQYKITMSLAAQIEDGMRKGSNDVEAAVMLSARIGRQKLEKEQAEEMFEENKKILEEMLESEKKAGN